MKKGKLVIYTGCSGVGKGTIMKELLKNDESIKLSVSCTTRVPRPGEIDGVHYYFVSKDKFNKIIEEDGFLEYATFCDNMYGTPEKAVDELLEKGYNVFLEIEVQGGMQVMKKRPDCVSIFITPPSVEELERRLRGRGTEDEETIKKRMYRALEELTYEKYYKYSVLNDEVDRATQEIIGILKKESE
ncbi:MAG: guanylate kinase [Ruminococcus sp.]|nr:guanylate kinase [Ruminococcus sp.]